LSIKGKATKIALRWAAGAAASLLLSWPVLLGLVLLLLVVIILSSAGGPAALAPPALAANNYSCTIAVGPASALGAGAVTPATAPAGDYAGTTLNAEQMKIAGTITAVTKQMRLTRRAAEIALAVAMQESALDPNAVNGPWVGLFQQAVDPGGGLYTRYDRSDPAGATMMFLEQLVRRVPGYDTDPRQNWELGEVVQESGVGQNVAQWQDMGKALAAVLYSGTPPAQVNTTCATDTTGAPTEFDPGNIISDAVFYNDSAFPDIAAVQAALDRIGASCTAPTCLRLDTYTPGIYHLDWCKDWAGPPGPQSYASILFHLGKSCGINPQVAIVMIQKESQGLTRANPPAALTGFHCPDTGPGGTANCAGESAGVWAQTFGMFQALALLRVDSSKVNYPEGKTSNILWNVAETGCGSTPVTVQNRATATLYTYTPYQPNAASLAAYPGEGDACSSYGNRNFFRLFTDYFGSTGGGKPTPVAVSTNGPDVTIPNNSYVTPALAGKTIKAPTPAVARGLAAGFAVLGMPYVWGGGGSGEGPNNGCGRGGGDYNSCGTTIGFDCSGLTGYVMAQAGESAPDNSGAQRAGGVPVPWDQGQPGDIVGFPGHVATYLGIVDGQRYILEASWVGTPIHVVPLTRTDYDQRLHRYWGSPSSA
jgi:cell wall-associated NlpC family hydrolase